jgi:hypothetical protein
MNKLAFKLDLKEVLELLDATFKPTKGKATQRPPTPLVGTSKGNMGIMLFLYILEMIL